MDRQTSNKEDQGWAESISVPLSKECIYRGCDALHKPEFENGAVGNSFQI